ncbi:protein 4.1-like [Aplochiton taeniatus]
MTTDEADTQQKKQAEVAPDAGPSEPQDAAPGPPAPDEEQLKPRARTSAGRGLSRLFSSFLKRRSQCEGEAGERGGGGGGEPKAPIVDPEDLRVEGDVALDQHSISSNEGQVRGTPYEPLHGLSLS